MAGRRILAGLAATIILALAFVAGYAAYPLLHVAPPPAAGDATQADAMANYWQVWDLLDRDFYGAKPDTKQRTYGAIAGMVESFGDPYTFFVEPQPRELERDQLAGKFGGIGATLEQTETGWLLHPLPDQPAAQAGVRDGDRLLKVDSTPITTTMTSEEIVVARARRAGVAGDAARRARRRAGGASEELTFTVTAPRSRRPASSGGCSTTTRSSADGRLSAPHDLF